jgi:hypothetical protein
MTVAWITNMTNKLIQAYRQTPWRVQKQWIGLFTLALVLVASVALVYLNITTQAATTGAEIQNLEMDAIALMRQIETDRTQLAKLTSIDEMLKRANDLGFVPIESSQIQYMVIPDYHPRQTAALAPAPEPELLPAPLLRPEYTQSLWDVIFHNLSSSGKSQAGTQP